MIICILIYFTLLLLFTPFLHFSFTLTTFIFLRYYYNTKIYHTFFTLLFYPYYFLLFLVFYYNTKIYQLAYNAVRYEMFKHHSMTLTFSSPVSLVPHPPCPLESTKIFTSYCLLQNKGQQKFQNIVNKGQFEIILMFWCY